MPQRPVPSIRKPQWAQNHERHEEGGVVAHGKSRDRGVNRGELARRYLIFPDSRPILLSQSGIGGLVGMRSDIGVRLTGARRNRSGTKG